MDHGDPGYLDLFRSGELRNKIDRAMEMLGSCTVCPRNCGVDRTIGETGFCRMGRKAVVASYGPHFGEERPLVGRSGSGTIFFSGCNLACQYCQNWDISQRISGRETDPQDLAGIMMKVQGFGCHNINLVSPSHVVPQFLEALDYACMKGLEIPIVYNTGGYDSLETLKILDGIVDIYMPDMKYSDPSLGSELSLVPEYPKVNRAAVKEMHRQVGDLVMDGDGVARRGLLVRHLVLPNGAAGTEEIVRFLADEISPNTYVNIMDQYRPEYKAMEHPIVDRRLSSSEFGKAVRSAREAGLHRLD
ncbi:MAG: radical SAM protein [Thermoplasmatota archaeon]